MKKRSLIEKFKVEWNKNNIRAYRFSYDKAIKKLFNQNYINWKWVCSYYEIREALNEYVEAIDLDDLILFKNSNKKLWQKRKL